MIQEIMVVKQIMVIPQVYNCGPSNLPPSSQLPCSSGSLDHCHIKRETGIDKKARRKLVIATLLCLFLMTIEIVGGVLSNSLAIATDAAHLLMDLASFMISLFAIWLANRPSTQQMSFGWHRAEVIGATISVLLIWLVTGVLVYAAILRAVNGEYEMDADVMLITSAIGVGVNIIIGCSLHQHGHSHQNRNSFESGEAQDDGHGHPHDAQGKKKRTSTSVLPLYMLLGILLKALVCSSPPSLSSSNPS